MKRLAVLAIAAAFLATGLAPPAEAQPSAGKVKVETPGLVLILQVDKKRTVTVPPLKEVPLPARTYTVKEVIYHAKAPKRRTVWRLDSWYSTGKLKEVTVTAGATTTVAGGGVITLTPKATLKRSPTGQRTLDVSVSATDEHGVIYHPRAKTGRRPGPCQKVAICTTGGRVIASGDAVPEYG